MPFAANALQCIVTGEETHKTAHFPWDFVTLPEKDRAMVIGNMHKKLGKDRACGSGDMFADTHAGQTDTHTHTHTDVLITILCRRSRGRSKYKSSLTVTSMSLRTLNANVNALRSLNVKRAADIVYCTSLFFFVWFRAAD